VVNEDEVAGLMFTGIVSELGEVEAVEGGDAGARLRVRAELAGELSPGDSVSVSGVCLTAASVDGGSFEADVMRQTLGLTTLGSLEPGDRVNLELPLRPTDRLGGHIVQGHVDATARVTAVEPDGIARRIRVELPADLLPYVVERGSIALAGVSLTIAATAEDWIEVSLIPETLERTTLGGLEPGDEVNVECDVLARQVRRLIASVPPLDEESE
jgi:riboflavin synthase